MAKYFTLKELCASPTADAQGIDNFPTFEIVSHLEELTEKFLDPLREAWKGPIIVTSGYRCPELNTAIGGVKTSAHKRGYAADLKPGNGRTEEFMAFAKEWAHKSGVRFDQVIREYSGKTVWLHVGLYSSNNSQRGQIFDLEKK